MKSKKCLIPLALLLAPGVGAAEFSSRAECVLAYMPGVMNDPVADMVADHCRTAYVGGKYDAKPRAAGEGGMRDALDCVLKHAAATPNERAAEAIRNACKELYPAPQPSFIDR